MLVFEFHYNYVSTSNVDSLIIMSNNEECYIYREKRVHHKKSSTIVRIGKYVVNVGKG